MGTRNLTCVVMDNKMKVAQYCQWDGYLSGQGQEIMNFIAKNMKLEKFKKAIKECKFLTEAEIESRHKEVGIEGDFMDMKQAEMLKNRFPSFSRDTGAKLLSMIQDKKKDSII